MLASLYSFYRLLWTRSIQGFKSWFILSAKQKRDRKKTEKLFGILSDILLAVVFGAISMPVGIKWIAWFCCWIIFIYIVGLYDPMRRFPTKTKLAAIVMLAFLFIIFSNSLALSMWMQEQSSKFSGDLVVIRTSKIVIPDSDVRLQVGRGGMTYVWTGAVPQLDWSPPRSALILRRTNGDLYLTVDVRDKNNDLIVHITDNHWDVSPSNSWDHNYTTNSLEVKARNGRVVLKTVLFEDRVQIEGEWWNEEGLGIRMLSPPHKPEISDSQYVKLNPVVDPDDPKISEMFQYPSRLLKNSKSL
jgi:hypothetical protein